MPPSARAYLAHLYLIATQSVTALTPLLRLSLRQDHPLCPGPLRKLKAAVGDTSRLFFGSLNSESTQLSLQTTVRSPPPSNLRPVPLITSVAHLFGRPLWGYAVPMDLRAAAATNILNGGKAGHQCVGSASEDDTRFISISFARF